ncbi:MAG: rRNA maturation RNase YbeY [Gammaproteobacteria bacterium]|jgi:probable rRNA maturation factor|nr:rRNA maturation RNase YbeY [Gammaproteobacteria bacterium]MBT4491948.1 rRNA maturation RNase YbeY [Gammaproteobacteria bacterium]MBT7369116.1 rRNA maturation RNase YbeY [Gammaproteobacteria bacterium]
MNGDHLVEVSRSTDSVDEEPDEGQIGDWVRDALNQLGRSSAEVSVRIVAKDEMASLNEQYRGKASSTNVLSFSSGIATEERDFLGDIVVCNQVVLEESRQFGQSCENRFAHMMVHGLLHLLGHDHIEDSERKEMEDLEKQLLATFGISDPYEVAG